MRKIRRSEVSLRLIEARKAKGMTQQEVADILNVERSTYTKYETTTELSATAIKDLCLLYGVSADYLLGIEKKCDE